MLEVFDSLPTLQDRLEYIRTKATKEEVLLILKEYVPSDDGFVEHAIGMECLCRLETLGEVRHD